MDPKDLFISLIITIVAFVVALWWLDETYAPNRWTDYVAAGFALSVPVVMWAAILDQWWRLQ